MRQVEVALNDELAQKLEGRASELGLMLDKFLAKAIEQNADKLIRPKVWMPRDRWDAIMRGDNCNDCAHLASGQNPHGYKVADLRVSRLDLFKSQFVPARLTHRSVQGAGHSAPRTICGAGESNTGGVRARLGICASLDESLTYPNAVRVVEIQ